MPKENYHSREGTLDFMVDIETLARRNDAVILSIGAILFNVHDDTPLRDKEGNVTCPNFYRAIHIPTQKGRSIDPDTQAWWNDPKRAKAWQQINEDPNKVHLVQALDELWDFMKEGPNGEKVVKGWGCAPSFDQAIIGHAMRTQGISSLKKSDSDLPIPFWNEMDVRTVETFIFGEKNREIEATYHNALDDCISQAHMLQRAWNVIQDVWQEWKNNKEENK